MPFPDHLGTITCHCVLRDSAPVLAVSHAGGDWQMYCSFEAHDFDSEAAMAKELTVVHIAHLTRMDPTLEQIADLDVDTGAERTCVGGAWTRFADRDDD